MNKTIQEINKEFDELSNQINEALKNKDFSLVEKLLEEKKIVAVELRKLIK